MYRIKASVSYHHILAKVVLGADDPELFVAIADRTLFMSVLALAAVWLAML
jgi:hypothetical protein